MFIDCSKNINTIKKSEKINLFSYILVLEKKAFVCNAIFLFLFISPVKSLQLLYWVGANGANASVASNWSTTNQTGCASGVNPSGSAPTTGDVIHFDADCDNSAVWDSSPAATVGSVTLNTSYTGTVTLQRSFQTTSTMTY